MSTGKGLRSMMVVLTSIHLRRVALSFRRAFRGSGIELSFIAVPEDLSEIRPKDQTSQKTRREVYEELIKYIGYYALNN